jgi:hypothetical protein
MHASEGSFWSIILGLLATSMFHDTGITAGLLLAAGDMGFCSNA